MANVCTTNLESQIQTNIDSLTTSSCVEDLFAAAVSVSEFNSDCITSFVSNCAALPDRVICSTVPIGHMVFVNSIKAPVIATQSGWASLDGRTFREDLLEGELFTWGKNYSGSLATNNTTSRFSPGTVSGGGTNWRVAALTDEFGGGVKTDGTLWTWGQNDVGQLGIGSTGAGTYRSSPGTVAGGGTNWRCIVIPKSVLTGSLMALKTDGTLWTWGCNSNGELGTNTTVARSSPGTTAGGIAIWCHIFATRYSVGGITTSGILWTWGGNNNGILGTGDTTNRSSPGTVAGGGTNWCNAAGSQTMLGIKTDGTLWTWGSNSFGAIGDGTTTARSSPGTVFGGGTNWSRIAGGCEFSLAIKTDGTLWTWGFNSSGRLGDGSYTSRSSPGTVFGGGTNWCRVDANEAGMALKIDGTLWTWGPNGGLLGDGTSFARNSPGTTAGGGTTWVFISAGQGNQAAIRR